MNPTNDWLAAAREKIRRALTAPPRSEGPVEHLKNALAILQAHRELGEKDALVADDARAVEARIRIALQQLEPPRDLASDLKEDR
jgi:hypothetical protein